MPKHTSTKKATSQATREAVTRAIRILIDSNSIDERVVTALHSEIRLLEFNNIKTLEAAKIALSLVTGSIKERLNSSDLSNKQKTEIMLIAQLKAYGIADAIISSIENLNE